MKEKARLDELLVARGLAPSREKARALVLAGQVLVEGQKAEKAGQRVPVEAQVEVREGMKYVSRAGAKLEAALEGFRVEVTGKVCLDVGASTGGFTDCLLQRGARKVFAVDVGRGQMDWKLRQDARVALFEGVNARYLTRELIPEPVDIIVCDVSFISVTMILDAIVPLLAAGGAMIILVKPQFEVGKGQVGKGGIVRDAALREAACRRVREAVEARGFQTDLMASPVPGAEGNQEYLLYAVRK